MRSNKKKRLEPTFGVFELTVCALFCWYLGGAPLPEGFKLVFQVIWKVLTGGVTL